jgi:hypothetical protein
MCRQMCRARAWVAFLGAFSMLQPSNEKKNGFFIQLTKLRFCFCFCFTPEVTTVVLLYLNCPLLLFFVGAVGRHRSE